MKRHTIPGVLALSLAASASAWAQNEDPGRPKATAVSPPVAIPTGETPTADPAAVKTDSSYGLGYRTGGEFGQRYGNYGVTADDLDTAAFLKGFLDGLKGSDPALSDDKVGAAMQALGDLLQQREQELAARNLEAGQAFLEKNKAKEGVKTLESGLQYEVLAPGGGETYQEPKEGEPAKQFQVHYRGSLIDGTEFDASPEGEPVTMDLEVIDGFREALTTMPVGAKWRLFVPSGMAYGEQRRSPEIGPNSTLIFELELLKIEDAPPAQPGGLPFPMPQPGE